MIGNGFFDDGIILAVFNKPADHPILKKHLHPKLRMVKEGILEAVEGLQLLKPPDIVKEGDEQGKLMILLRKPLSPADGICRIYHAEGVDFL